MWVEASVEAPSMDSVPAILTVPGCKASQDGQASLVRVVGCPQQEQVPGLGLELELELEQGLEPELELVAAEAGTGGLASKAGRAASEQELELEL